MASGEPQADSRVGGLTRRQMLTRTAAAGAAAWVAPQIISTPAAAAATCGFVPTLLAGGGSSTTSATGDFVSVDDAGVWWNARGNGGAAWVRLGSGPGTGTPPPTTFVPTLLAGGGDAQGTNSAFVAANATGLWYRSTNGGLTWSQMTNANINGFAATLVAGFGNANGDNADFVAYGPGVGNRWRYTRNAGTTWNSVAGPQPTGGFAPNLLAGGGDNATAFGDFVAIDNSRTTERIWYSTNSGAAWAASTAATGQTLPNNVTWRLLAGGDDINGSFVVTDAQGTWRFSSNGGATWSAPGTPPPAGFVPLLLAGSGDNDGQAPVGGDFVATDGLGLWYRSSDFGNTWTQVTGANAPPTSFRPTLLAGVADGGGVNDFVAYGGCTWYRSADGGASWTLVPATSAPT